MTVSPARMSLRDVVGIMERGHRRCRAADEDRLEHSKWRHGSRAADVDSDFRPEE
jgi:hypothetical protein